MAKSEPTRPAVFDKVRAAHGSINAGQTPIFVAQEAGIFTKYGLEVDLAFMSGITSIHALVAGELDVTSVSAVPIVSAGLGGADTVMIGGTYNKLAFQIYSVPGLTRPEDLKGKRLGISRKGAATDIAGRFALSTVGLKPEEDVAFVEMGESGNIPPAMEAGGIDAGVLDPPLTGVAKRMGYNLLIDLRKIPVEYQTTGLATTRSFIGRNPDVIKRFIMAYVEGIHKFKTDKEFSIRTLGKYAQMDNREELEDAYDFYSQAAQEVPLPSLAGIKTILGVEAERVPTARDADPARFADLRFVQELKDSGFIDRLYRR